MRVGEGGRGGEGRKEGGGEGEEDTLQCTELVGR